MGGKPTYEALEQRVRDLEQEHARHERVEAALRESEEKFKAAFEGSHDAITLTTKEGKVLDCNQRAVEMYGLESKDGFLHRRPADFSPPFQPDGRSSREVSREKIDKVMREGGFSRFEWLHQRSDGEIFPTEIILTSYQLGGETVLQATIRDITERKRAEEEREKLHAQLLQAQKMESVGRLAGGVAHDFNNMLGVIIGNAELAMLEVDPDAPVYQNLQQIFKTAQRSAGLVRQLLGFARKQTVSPKVLDLNDTVSGMLKMLRQLIGEDIDLVWMPGHGLRAVKIDPSQIDQILANLMVNARDAIAGVGKVTIEAENVVFDEAYCAEHAGFVPGEYVMLAVSDNGCGMDKEILEHLFEPFFTTKEVGKGTGLGLATVYGIVKQNDGFINVYSEPGEGTTFRIYLPRFGSEAVEDLKEGAREMVRMGTETVLLVEDDDAILQTARSMLERLGYRVLSANSITRAIDLAETHAGQIHLLITDVVMPELNGRDLARRLAHIRPRMKTLFMSGYSATVIAHRGVLDQGMRFIQKPFSIKELAAGVREALDL
jgi:two-component system, cell cycle sensor histidine kinase and response regulator CckA